MKIKNLFPGSFGSNCYIVSDSSHAAVIDPSASVSGILNYLAENQLTLDYIILTHGHFDHIGGAYDFYKLGTKIYMGENELDFITDENLNLSCMFGDKINRFEKCLILLIKEVIAFYF